jgi:branched-chain amino acid transport system ATP-binding protein
MLAIGRALMTRPALLCLDEPSMGLAPRLVEDVFDIIRTINEQGTTIFVIEQNVSMALSIAHRGYVLQMGEVVLAGSAQALVENPLIQKAYLGTG